MSATQPQRPESGLRNHRVDFARESAFGDTGADPAFLKYSKALYELTWTSDAVVEPVMRIGSPDPETFLKGPEMHEVTIAYNLIKWFTENSGDALDASYDGLARDSDNLLPNSHTLVDREDKGSIAAESTINGSTSLDTRIYKVGRGGLIDEAEIIGDPSDAQPITVELTYLFQKVRSYQIDQPDASTLLYVKSDNANDSTQSITIEDEGGATAEDVSLDGTTVVSTSSSFDNIDAAELSSETEGTITIGINDGDATSPTEGDVLMEIKGSDEYNDVEGDLGVPALDSGSRETEASLGNYEQFIGDRVTRAGSPVAYEIPSATLSVSNNVEDTEQSSRYGMALHPGNRELTFVPTIFGESATYQSLVDHLTANTETYVWEMTGGNVQLDDTALTEPGDIAAEEGEAVMTVENTFRAGGLTITEA